MYSSSSTLSGLLIGTSAAIVTILCHGIVEFNLHITANAFLFVFLLGISVAMSQFSKDAPCKKIVLPTSSVSSKLITLISALAVCVILFLSIQEYIADKYYKQWDKNKNTEMLINAGRAEPANDLYRYELGKYYLNAAALENTPVTQRVSNIMAAKNEFEKAIQISPTQSLYWASYGWLMGNIKKYDTAEYAFETAQTLASHSNNISNIYKAYKQNFKQKNDN
jgi:tetratricopeptide (TPR) repeat protein